MDMIIAFAAIVGILLSVFLLWNHTTERIATHRTSTELRQFAKDVSNELLMSPGSPTNWSAGTYPLNVTQIGSIGFAHEPWVLNTQRMDGFRSMNYSQRKQILGILGPGYEFDVKVAYYNGTSSSQIWSAGANMTDPSFVAVQERMALYNRSWVTLTVRVWQE